MTRGLAVVGMAALLGCGGSTSGANGDGNSGGHASGGSGQGGSAASGQGATGGSAQGASGGAGGSTTGGFGGGGSPPVGSQKSNKVDLLFVVDNSASMADKQDLLRASSGDLVQRLVNPPCVDAAGAVVDAPPSPSEACAAGERQFAPVDDLHMAVITSSLGTAGADQCSPAAGAAFNETQDGHAHLQEGSVSTYQDFGFLKWDSKQTASPPGVSDVTQIVGDLQNIVVSVGEAGCGYESTLEAFYRFLIDPEPEESMARVPCFDGDDTNSCVAKDGIDQTVLEQRAEFLRPDSAVMVVLLSDENDCSVIRGSQYYIALQALTGSQQFFLPRATSECDNNVNDTCCYSCGQATPAECTKPDHKNNDANCSDNGGFYANADEDNLNLRCWDQKRRFGIDFLYPVERYENGLLGARVPNQAEEEVANPLYTDLKNGGPAQRTPALVFLTGIVGAPWQNLTVGGSGDDLEYLSAPELRAEGRWAALIGDVAAGTQPTDPHMIESSAVRSGTSPISGQSIEQDPTSMPTANPINGHEYDTHNGDLQYACIFPQAVPINCDPSTGGKVTSCDCSPGEELRNKPLCQDPVTGAQGTTQFFAKAYPGRRHLELLHALDDHAVVTSICARNTTDTGRPDFAFRPVVDAMMERLSLALE